MKPEQDIWCPLTTVQFLRGQHNILLHYCHRGDINTEHVTFPRDLLIMWSYVGFFFANSAFISTGQACIVLCMSLHWGCCMPCSGCSMCNSGVATRGGGIQNNILHYRLPCGLQTLAMVVTGNTVTATWHMALQYWALGIVMVSPLV